MISDKYLFVSPQDTTELARALQEKQLSGTSPLVEEYGTRLAAYFGVPFALPTSSGSAALHTALHILGVGAGSEVLVSAAAPIPSLLPILTCGAKPVFVDTMPHHLGFDLKDLQRKITNKTKAALAVPLWGYPFELSDTLRILNAAGCPLIEDIAQAHGTIIEQRKAGTHGTLAILSTHDRKLLATGEGGALLTRDQELYYRAKQLSQLGFLDGVHYGVNYKMSTLQAALGIARLPSLDWQIEERRARAHRFLRVLPGQSSLIELTIPETSRPNYYALVLYAPSAAPEQMRRVITFLQEEGIPSDIVRYNYSVAYHHPLFRQEEVRCPHAERLVKRITTIPVHPGITTEEETHIMVQLQKSLTLFE